MDYDKLIEQLHKEAYGSDVEDLLLEAATALSTLQAENERLRKELEYDREHANAYHEECGQWEAENEKLRAELDAARAALAELTGLADGSVQTLFGVPLERMWELSQAELEGRIVLRSAGAGRREASSLRERLAADEWIDTAVELPPDDDIVLAIVSGDPADNITLEDAYELASYSAEDGWIVEQFELWENSSVTWWRPLPDPPEKKKEER